jgi:hypothetical protein
MTEEGAAVKDDVDCDPPERFVLCICWLKYAAPPVPKVGTKLGAFVFIILVVVVARLPPPLLFSRRAAAVVV